MALRVLAVYPQRCTGCRLCEQFCSWKHDSAVNPARARIAIHRLHEVCINILVACSQCAKAPCISVCPERAISRVPETGGLHLDEQKCIGCRMCVEVCPRGCIKMDGDGGTPLLCDLCDGDPECATHCPEAAIVYAEPEVIDRGYREIAVQRMGWGEGIEMSVNLGGLTGRMLRVNLSDRKIQREATPVWAFERFLGARGAGAALLLQELKKNTDPLGPDNKLIFLTGPLEGTLAPGANKITVSFRSPLSGTYSFSLCGGHLAAELKFAGWDGLIVEGQADSPVYLWIDNGRAELRDARHLWGKLTHATESALRQELHDPDARIMVIGPAGEKRVRYACIQTDHHREFGRGGAGAVMGSKNLKAIAIRGTGQVRVADPGELQRIAEEVLALLRLHPKGQARRNFGTPEMVEATNQYGYWATRNFTTGHFEQAGSLTGPKLREEIFIGDNSCFGCNIACGKISPVTCGPFAGGKVEGPEFESLGLLGPNCGVADPAAIVAAVSICDAYGFDTMSAGAVISMAMECFERGLIGAADTGGLDLRFGNGDALVAVAQQIGERQGIGDALAEGSRRAAQCFGAPELAMQVKGMELATYEPRGVVGMGLSYVISPKGGHHMIAPTMGAEVAGDPSNRLRGDGKAALVRDTQFIMAQVDSMSLCSSMRFVLGPQMMLDLYGAVTGQRLMALEGMQIGECIANLERLFNVREGLRRKDDQLPKRLMVELMPSGPSAGNTVPLDAMLDEYYALMGWDQDGVPGRARMQALGLEAEWVAALADAN